MFNANKVCRNKLQIFKIVAAFSVFTLCCLYVFQSSIVSNQMVFKFFTRPTVLTQSEFEQLCRRQEETWDQAFYVNTRGCRMPSFPVMDESIERYFGKAKPIVCKAVLTISNDTHVWIAHNRSQLLADFGISEPDTIFCDVDALRRVSDTTNEVDTSQRQSFRYGEAVAVETEFVQVHCTFNVNTTVTNYHYFIAPKFGFGNRSERSNRISVMIIGIDSVSRLNFHRSMNQTASVLAQMNAFELFGYNKIGDNTFPNLMAILTGLEIEELTSTCLTSNFDGCNFIWDLYKERGYNTVFAEDWNMAGLFNFNRPGFLKQPTDLRLKPIVMEMEAHAGSQHDANSYMCLGGERTVDLLLNYIGMFVRSIGWSSYFSFFWTSTYSHDYLERPQLIDEQFAEMLINITSSETFENTFLIVMSDHGLRFGSFRKTYQGSIEERLPFMFLVPPKWFYNRYPDALLNLMSNRRSLTTPFDIYETLRDIIELDQLTSKSMQKRTEDLAVTDPMPRGISLFLPIPDKRSCSTAGISPHFCTCHEKQTVATNDQRVQKVARDIVNQINQMISEFDKCQRLSLNAILDAHISTSNVDIVKKDALAFADVTVRIQTKPGMAEFEATSRLYSNGRLEKTGSVSRTNQYGEQSVCVNDYNIKLFCFCDSFL